MSPETQTKKVHTLHIKPEGYYSPGDPEFLDQLKQQLADGGFNVEELLFSGFDGTGIKSVQDIPRHPYIFAMNEAGWRGALKIHEHNPAEYAEGFEVPCIGVYDKNQLCEIYASNIDQEITLEDRVELKDIVLGDALKSMPPSQAVSEAIAHLNYPEGSPTDALLAMVFIEE